jgi:hypothetical protein
MALMYYNSAFTCRNFAVECDKNDDNDEDDDANAFALQIPSKEVLEPRDPSWR